MKISIPGSGCVMPGGIGLLPPIPICAGGGLFIPAVAIVTVAGTGGWFA